MLIIGAIAAALIIAVALGAHAVSRRVMQAPDTKPADAGDEKKEEWSALAAAHDPEKGYAAAMAGSDAYKAMTELEAEIGKAVHGSMTIQHALPDAKALTGFDFEKDLLPDIDMDERRQYAAWSDERAEAASQFRDALDLACVMAVTSQSEAEQSLCLKEASKIHGMLDTGLAVYLSAPAEDGVHTLRKELHLSRDEVLAMAGREPDGNVQADLRHRHSVFLKAGYRCCRCGRSPMVGARLFVHKDGLTGKDECVCSDCGGARE